MSQKETFWSSWRERLSALRNVPPILKIVWQSGPGVVTFGIVARIIAALLPIALTYIPKLIIDILVRSFEDTCPSPQRLWWLVAGGVRHCGCGQYSHPRIDYTDSLLADKYTRHVSIEVMRHAASLT